MEDKVLVFPSWKSNSTTTKPEDYFYRFIKGDLFDPIDGKIRRLIAIAHTHPDKEGEASPSVLDFGRGSDATFGARKIPGKMNFVFGQDNYLRGITADRSTGSLKYTMYTRKDFQYIRVSEVLKGQKINLRYTGQQFKYVEQSPKK